MDREILVSVCTLTYNHEAYLRDTLEGILMQKVDFPMEILVNDDASTDGTRAILREYADFLRAYHDRIYCPEQDFLNLKFAGMITRLPVAYNLMYPDPAYTTAAPRIIHFLGAVKPWSRNGWQNASRAGHYFRRYAVEAERWGNHLTHDFRTAVAENARRV